jgi:hypothetical protein
MRHLLVCALRMLCRDVLLRLLHTLRLLLLLLLQ